MRFKITQFNLQKKLPQEVDHKNVFLHFQLKLFMQILCRNLNTSLLFFFLCFNHSTLMSLEFERVSDTLSDFCWKLSAHKKMYCKLRLTYIFFYFLDKFYLSVDNESWATITIFCCYLGSKCHHILTSSKTRRMIF